MLSFHRQRKKESRSLFGLRFDPHAATVALDDAFADREADTGARIFFTVMQALENDKNTLKIPGVNADAVVADGKYPVLFILPDTHMNPGAFLPPEFDGIPNQVLEE